MLNANKASYISFYLSVYQFCPGRFEALVQSMFLLLYWTVSRFGSFQICKGPDRESGREGPSAGRPDIVRQLADYVIRNFYPQVHVLRLDNKASGDLRLVYYELV